MTERVSKLEVALQAALEACEVKHGEACIRVESVEENLCQLTESQKELQYDQASLMLRVESQQMYSHKQTLLVAGPERCSAGAKFYNRLKHACAVGYLGATSPAHWRMTSYM